MRFRSVTAHHFGPFTAATLEFAPGMNLVCGPNESGKSTWHSALYAALCGMRRSRGAGRLEGREFAARYKPWGEEEWEVSACIELEDGRIVELHHDLAGLVDCGARDMTLGKDLSSEIIFEGTPDGSSWLGLDRRAFLAIACIRQAEILGVLDDPSLLQEHLQRAADTGGRDETAAAALDRIDAYLSEHVGLNRAHSTKPLRTALEREDAAKRSLEAAASQREEFARLAGDLESAERKAREAERNLLLVEAARAVRDAEACQQRLAKVRELLAKLPDGPPAPRAEDDALALEVGTAVNDWENRPEVSSLSGRTSAELRGDLERTPLPPDGDVAPHPTFEKADAALRDAGRSLELHERMRPAAPKVIENGGTSAGDLRSAAQELSIPGPLFVPELDNEVRVAEATLARLRLRRRLLVTGGLLLAVLGAAMLGLGYSAWVIGFAVAAISLLAWGIFGQASLLQIARSSAVEAQLKRNVARQRADEWRSRIESVRMQVSGLGLPSDPQKLRAFAAELDTASALQRQLDQWVEERAKRQEAHEEAARALRQVLFERGVSPVTDLEESRIAYLDSCADRARTAAKAARRTDLENQLQTREAAETAAAAAGAARKRASENLKSVAGKCGVSSSEESETAQALRAWLSRRSEEIGVNQAARDDWTQAQALLDGGTIEDLEAEAARRWAAAKDHKSGLDEGDIAGIVLEADPAGQIRRLQSDYAEIRRRADTLRGQIEERSSRLLPLAEAEEELEAARANVANVQKLERTLKTTRDFLENAQERAHKSIASILAATIKPWLPAITAGRYDDVTLDPETLAVQVHGRSGRWRDADKLSLGTREQIYLLLHMAMADHLTKPGEICPLLMDDVTVESDAGRKLAILSLLKAIGESRQVILFSQEADVLAWAEANLGPSRDKLLRLDPAVIGD